MNQIPPKWIIKCLEAICPDHLLDEVEGDLFEYYAYLVSKGKKGHAKRKAIGFLLMSAPRLLLQRKYYQPIYIDMFRNYIVVAIRNIKRQWGYSLINILGLAVGLACCMLIGVYVLHELSYDRFHAKSDSIFRVNLSFTQGETSNKTFNTPTALLPNMKRELAQVKEGTRVFNVSMFSPVVVQKGNVKYQEEQFLYVDSTFLKVFSFELLQGNAVKCLTEPNSVVLTEKTAFRYFGNEEPLNQIVRVDGTDYTVTGILRDVPDNSHLQFDFLASFSSLRAAKREIWGSANYATYVELTDPTAYVQVGKEVTRMAIEKTGNDWGNLKITFDLIPLTAIHLRSDVSEMQPQSNVRYIYILSAIGLLILLIACINYMNLATARSVERSREVGMRKVLGAVRKQLYLQFMGESSIITLLALVIAVGAVYGLLSQFNQLTSKELGINDLFSQPMLIGMAVTFILVSFLAGAYPALSLSGYTPSKVLKGRFTRSKSGSLMRQVLVVLQFSISIFLIIGTLVIYRQLNFMRDQKLGFNKENVLILPTDDEVNKNFQRIKTELEKRDDVLGVASASESPTEIGGSYTIKISEIMDEPLSIKAITVDPGFLKAMDMKIINGRNYIENDFILATKENDEEQYHTFIVNQELLNQVGVEADEALGRKVELNGRKGEIIGVVENFHFNSLHRKISPLALFIEPWQFNKIFIRIKPQNLQKTLMAVEDDWKSIVPDRPFVFEFMDDEYEAMYRNEVRLGSIFTVFAVLAIVIACLGLFGLVSFAVEQRTKEIGVRKVLGASISSLFFLISKDFSKLVMIAFAIAAPLGYWLMDNWLTDFEYRTSVGIVPIIISIVSSLAVALLTVSYQSIRAALINPAKTLRTE